MTATVLLPLETSIPTAFIISLLMIELVTIAPRFTHYLFCLLSDASAQRLALPAKTNAVMKAWSTVFITGMVSQGESR